MNYDRVGLLIAKIRKEKGMTQKELADKLNITDRAVSKWERGLGCPDISLLEKLSDILDISILELLKGRRLEKSELIANEEVIETMKFTKNSYKQNIIKLLNRVIVFLISFLSLLIISYNIISHYNFSKTYKNDLYNDFDITQFSNIDKMIITIKNNQGNYSKVDYEKIINYVQELQKNFDYEYAKKFIKQKQYTYNDLKNFYNKEYKLLSFKYYQYSDDSIYNILYKYSSDILTDSLEYYQNGSYLFQNYYDLADILNNPYLYSKLSISYDVVDKANGIIYFKLNSDQIVLKDIIKAGEINE